MTVPPSRRPSLPPVPRAFRDGLRDSLALRSSNTRDGSRTVVVVNDFRFPAPSQAGPSQFLLTSRLRLRLQHPRFDDYMSRIINEADHTKGRAIFAVDVVTNEVVAAVSYHIPHRSTEFVLITALAPRIDSPRQQQVGKACIPLLKACVHEIATQVGHGRTLGLWASGPSAGEAKQIYGFRLGRRPSGARVGGREFLIQD